MAHLTPYRTTKDSPDRVSFAGSQLNTILDSDSITPTAYCWRWKDRLVLMLIAFTEKKAGLHTARPILLQLLQL